VYFQRIGLFPYYILVLHCKWRRNHMYLYWLSLIWTCSHCYWDFELNHPCMRALLGLAWHNMDLERARVEWWACVQKLFTTIFCTWK